MSCNLKKTEIVAIIKACASSGVSNFKYDTMEITFNNNPISRNQDKTNPVESNPVIEHQTDLDFEENTNQLESDEINQFEELMREFELQNIATTDPERWQQMSLESLSNEN